MFECVSFLFKHGSLNQLYKLKAWFSGKTGLDGLKSTNQSINQFISHLKSWD